MAFFHISIIGECISYDICSTNHSICETYSQQYFFTSNVVAIIGHVAFSSYDAYIVSLSENQTSR